MEEIRTDNTKTLENALERIKELEKENAELKERIKWYSEQICNKECAEVWGELDKAKGIIKDLIRFQPYIDKEMIFHSIGNEWKIAVLKARQFLSSSENLNK